MKDDDGAPSSQHGRLAIVPVVAALSYPFLLQAFTAVLSSGQAALPRYALAALLLVGALSVPVIGILVAIRLGRATPHARLHIRGKRVAFLTVAAPPLFVLFGVGLGLLDAPISDVALWLVVWLAAGIYTALGSSTPYPDPDRSLPAVRVLHGVLALGILAFVGFHLFNHLLGWAGPAKHAAVMELGRQIYRSPIVEPILIGLLLVQIATGGALVWRWSVTASDGYRIFQVASGDYLAVFILTHLNSALISARALRGIDTDWAWATGAPEGLLLDPWNIRLLPHYAFAVFFVLAHVASGLRVVLLAHGMAAQRAQRVWLFGMVAAAIVSLAVVLALCGARLP